MSLERVVKKIQRNINDYGLQVALNKCLANLIKPFYENKTYRIYAIDLENLKSEPLEESNFIFKVIDKTDIPFIQQIEEMEEWLQNRVKGMLEKGILCLVALDGTTVAGFNLVSLDEGHLPLVHFRKKLRPHEAWSEQITVRKDYRGKRLASLLRAHMFKVLKEKGITKFYGGAQASNIASLKLARRVGFVEIADVQYRKIFTQETKQCRRYRA